MKYVVLSAGQEWNDYCWEGVVSNNDRVLYINNLFPKFLERLWRRKLFRTPFLLKVLWYPVIKRMLKISQITTTLIVYDWSLITFSLMIVEMLKKEYCNLNIVYVFTNFVKVSGAKTYGLLEKLKDYYDAVFAFDPADSVKLGFEYSRLVYEPNASRLSSDVIEYDLFYVGQAKDRYPKLIEIFKNATSQSLRCKFFITGISQENRYIHPDIIYNSPLSYSEVLTYINKSHCLVDAVQGDSTGMTIKTSEAIFWNKKLITTNECITKEKYYKPSNICVYKDKCDLKRFLELEFLPYTDEDKYEFSSTSLFNQIKKLL